MNYFEGESLDVILSRAFNSIASCLELWRRTDTSKDSRVSRLLQAQSLIEVLLLSNKGGDVDPFNISLTRILLKTSYDITSAVSGNKVSFDEHVKSFRWMAKSMLDNVL